MNHESDTSFLNVTLSTEAIMSHEDHSLRQSENCRENIENIPESGVTGIGISRVSILRICLLTKGT